MISCKKQTADIPFVQMGHLYVDICNKKAFKTKPIWGNVHGYILSVRRCGPGSSVGIATELRAGRSWIESRWGRDFPPIPTGPGAHPASCKMGIGSFAGVKCGRGVLLTTHPLLVPRSWKTRAITSTLPLGHTGPVTGSFYFNLETIG